MTVGGRHYRLGAGSAASALLPSAALAAAAAAPDIRGIRAPKAGAGPWAHPQMLALAAIAALCLVYVLWRWLQHAGQPLSLSKSTLRRLESTRALMSPQTAQAFGASASDVIRDFIEKRFQVVATRQTTEEFLQALLHSSNEVLARHRASLQQFLQQCDFVKFTGDSLAVDDMESLLQSARCFVLEANDLPVA
jgi:hypothetical protein